MQTTIRYAQSGDMPAIADLSNFFIEKTVIHFGSTSQSAQEWMHLWESTRDVYPWFVAVETGSGAFVGFAKAGVWRSRPAYQWTAEAGIYLRPDAHRRGVGCSLYRALIDELRTRGFHSVLGGVTLPNPASQRLHESLGFTKVAHFLHAGFKFGAWHDVGFWQLMLNDGAACGE